MSILEKISDELQVGNLPKLNELIRTALDEGYTAQEILEDALLAGMRVVGRKFKDNIIFVPHVLLITRAMNYCTRLLKPYFDKNDARIVGTVILGTVEGDVHDIGKNLVKMLMEANGLTVIDLGIDVPSKNFVQAAIEHNSSIICCSALLSTTMNAIKEVIAEAEKQGIRNKVKIMIGGAPVTQTFCDKIGADYYTEDALAAAEVAVSMCTGKFA